MTEPSAPVQPSAPVEPSLPLERQRRILAILVFAAVLIWLDTTVLGIALERLADPVAGLGATPAELQWAVGAYSLLFATALFAAGALGDRYGHRTVLIAGLVTFGAASGWAAWAGSPFELILARGLMGAGGAMIMPASMSLIGWTFPPHRRAGAIALWTASSGFGVAGGPLLGGVLIDHFWWGSVFLVNLPIVVVALLGVVRFVPNPHSALRRPLDLPGLALSTIGLTGLAYGLIEGGQTGDWARWQVWGPIVAGTLALAAFVLVELRSAAPSFDPRLFRDARFAGGNLALATLLFVITGQIFYGNFYLQGARGLTALETGLAFLPGAVGVLVGAPLGARLVQRLGVAPVAGTALGIVALCSVANLTFDLDTSMVWFAAVGAVGGAGIGAAIAPTTAAVLATLPMARMGAGSAVNNAVRQVGSVLGVAILGTILTSAYRRGIEPDLAGLSGATRAAARTSAEGARHVAGAAGRPDLAAAADEAFVHAMHVTAAWAAVAAGIGVVALVVAFRRTVVVAGAPTPRPAEPATTGSVRADLS